MARRLALFAELAVIFSFAAGCVPPGAHVAPPGTVALKECGADGVIDDMEDGNNQITMTGERGGYWYTYADKEGSTVWPEQGDKGGTFTVVEGGHESKFAVEMKGKLAAKPIVYAAMGLNFRDPKEAYDAGAYEGITFWAKSGTGPAKLNVKMPDGNTDPDGQVCTACFNDYGTQITLTNEWQRIVLPFRALRQEADWGAPRKPHIDPKRLFAIHFEAKTPGADYDFWVDDIAFVCKG